MELLLLHAIPAARPIHHQSDWRMTCKTTTTTTTRGSQSHPAKWQDSTATSQDTISHHALHAITLLPSPNAHAHTNNSLTLTSLPDGDSAAKIRKTLPTKDNSNVITEKAAHAGWRAAGVRVQDRIYISSIAGNGWHWRIRWGLVKMGYK